MRAHRHTQNNKTKPYLDLKKGPRKIRAHAKVKLGVVWTLYWPSSTIIVSAFLLLHDYS